MSEIYLALYRKYRPRTFDGVISQEHITTTLKNQVANGTVAHAYLFTGSRGTGKTTCAKIMAVAVNCLDPQNGNPCLECANCREILSGEATDIVEMDAASNRGVDDVRRLRDEVVYTPVSCKYRVYIIDEVHMLTQEALNALLKTLEEPPAHIKFILATTEPHKLLATIISRCQWFEFRRVDITESTERLMEVAAKENVTLDKDAAELISRLSDGGMRDALSLLDHCISADDHITSETVRDCAGVADNKHLFAFAEMIAANDVAGCIRLLGELHKNSKDLAIVIDELAGIFRDIMVYKTAPGYTDLLSALPDDHARLAEISGLYDLGNILRCLALLQQCTDNIGKTKQRKLLAEMCLVKMCTGEDIRTAYTPRSAGQPISEPAQPNAVTKPPMDDYVLKSYEEMSERERVTAKKTQELIDRFKASESSAASAEDERPTEPAPVSPPPSELPKDDGQAAKNADSAEDISEPKGSAVDPPEDVGPLPWEEDSPPDGSINNNEDRISPETEQSLEPLAETAEATAEETSEETGVETSEPPAELTAEQWRSTVAQLDVMYSGVLATSTARLSGNVLEVTTPEQMVIANVKEEEHTRVEKMISEKLGFPIQLKLILAERSSDTEQSKLDKLLGKARQLGIEVQIKNDQNGG